MQAFNTHFHFLGFTGFEIDNFFSDQIRQKPAFGMAL
jgi:hypothetical protein